MSTIVPHYIGGQPFTGGAARTGPIFNPSTGAEIARCAYGDAQTVRHAVEDAAAAARRWGRASHATRQAVIFKLRELLLGEFDALAELIGREHGKTIADAKGELGRAIEGIEFACNAPHVTKGEYANNVGGDIDVFSVRRPLGVVACISPFNFPIMVPAVMMTMAISVGNTVIWKPSEKVPSAALAFAELWKKAGLPDGVLNIVNGDKEVVDAILDDEGISAISFVGSTKVGEYIYQRGTSRNKRVGCYTGGKNHMVVMPDADLEAAASAFVSAGFGSASQRCMSISLLSPVGAQTADRLREIIIPKINALKIGPYDQQDADFGAVISRESRDATVQAISHCVSEGGEMVIDGRDLKIAGHDGGYYLGPTLMDRLTPSMHMYREEVFGPVRGILRTRSLDEAIDLTNSHELGNGSVIYTRDGKSAHRFVMEVESGMIGVNVPVPLPAAYFNFGGLRRSKFGEAHMFGPDAARFFTKIKTVSQRWPEPESGGSTVSLAFNPASNS